MKKVLPFLVVAILLIPFSRAYAAPVDNYIPEDIYGHWAENVLNDLVDADIMKGYVEDNSVYVKPNKQITRAEFVAFLVRALELKANGTGKQFSDTKGHWAENDIKTASSLGIVKGISDTEFGPDHKIKRSEIAVFVTRAFANTVDFTGEPTKFADVPNNYWAIEAINKTSAVNIIKGTGNGFEPDGLATRAEASAMLYRAMMLEHSNVPTDELLTGLVLNNENEQYQLMQANNYEGIYDVFNKYGTGFYHAIGTSTLDELIAGINAGTTYTATRTGEPTAEVVSKSDRFAVVYFNGVSYEVKFQNGTEIYQDTVDASAEFHLKETNGEWKIYSSY